jgi:UDP-glucose 4-epimerase
MVIGAAGFLGSHLTERLVAERHVVDAVDDLSSGSLANLADARALGGELKIHTLDAATEGLVSLAMNRQPEVIVHLGLLPPGRASVDVASAAVQSTLRVLDAARQVGAAKVVVAVPAAAMYGEQALRDLPAKEGLAMQPAGLHGVVSRTVLDLLALYRRDHAVEHTALAVANCYGPRQRDDGGVIAAFAAARRAGTPLLIHGDGRQTRDFVFVDDVVDALVRSITKGDGLTINIGTGTATSIRDLAELMSTAAAPISNVGPRVGDVSRFALAPTRARIHLGWAAWTTLDQGLRSVV